MNFIFVIFFVAPITVPCIYNRFNKYLLGEQTCFTHHLNPPCKAGIRFILQK